MTATLLYQGHAHSLANARAADGELWIAPADVEQLGWSLEPEGMCHGERCVPVPPGLTLVADDDYVNFTGFSRYLEAPVLHDPESNTWVVGSEPPPLLPSPFAAAPDFSLPDLDGTTHSLSQHRGRKVFLVSWASW